MNGQNQTGNVSDPQTPQGEQAKLQIRDVDAKTAYANFFLVSSTPEEVVLNFGVNLLPPTKEKELRVDITNRTVMSYVSAKRLAVTLSNLIQRYESANGVIEIDPRRRQSTGPQLTAESDN